MGILLFMNLFLLVNLTRSQDSLLKNENWNLSINKNGTIASLTYRQSNFTVPFYNGKNAGPLLYLKEDDQTVILPLSVKETAMQTGYYDNISYSLGYKEENGRLLVVAKVRNNRNTPFQPTTFGLKLGLDTYMDEYPNWESKLFPTLLRCEKNHFWGYFMSPLGKILLIASPDPVASWSHDYSQSWGIPPYQFQGHRITSVNIDLINALPLPERHPQNLWQLMPGEEKIFRFYFEHIEKLDNVLQKTSIINKAPMLNLPKTAIPKNGEIEFSVYAQSLPNIKITDPEDKKNDLSPYSQCGNKYYFRYEDTFHEGIYNIEAKSPDGKISNGRFYVRKPYN
ncbi:MAG: hypothetical protein ACP5E3_20795, partial [Bacteroidales bacterium]